MNELGILMYIRIQNMLEKAQEKVDGFFNDEEGDTNFLSVLVLLAIALALAGVFIGFKNDILEWVDANIGDFFSLKGGR